MAKVHLKNADRAAELHGARWRRPGESWLRWQTVRMPWSMLILALSIFTGCGSTEGTQAKPVLLTIKRGDLVFARSFYGELVARDSIAIHTPELPGVWQLTVESVLADGTSVKKGDVVLRFSTGLLADELRDLEAQLALARAEMQRLVRTQSRQRLDLVLAVKRAGLDVKRASLNVISGVNLISKVELAKAKIDLKQAELARSLAKKARATFRKEEHAAQVVQRLKVASIEEKTRQKRAQMAAAKVLSPATGVLYAPYTRLNWVRGKAAAGSVTRPGDKLLEIPNLNHFNVEIFVRQRDASLLKKGDKATVRPAVLPDVAISATVVEKDDFAATRNERMGTRDSAGNLKEVRVVLELDRSLSELRPGGSVRADVRSRIAKNVLMVPLVALQEKEASYQATLDSGKKVAVTLGRVSTTHGEVLSGLTEGDRVLVATQSRKPRPEASSGAPKARGGHKGRAKAHKGKQERGRPSPKGKKSAPHRAPH